MKHYKNLPLLIEIWLTFLKWDIFVSLVPFKYWRNKLWSPNVSENIAKNYDFGIIRLVCALNEKVSRHHLRQMNCIRRSLTLQQVLNRRGIQTSFVTGVLIVDGAVKAHAWVELNNEPINDTVDNIAKYQLMPVASVLARSSV